MPGQQLATLTLAAEVLLTGSQVGIWLGGQFRFFTAVEITDGNAGTVLPDGQYFVRHALSDPAVERAANCLALVRAIQGKLTQLGLAYTVRAELVTFDAGVVVFENVHGLVVQATAYDPLLDFSYPCQIPQGPVDQFLFEVSRRPTIKPVNVQVAVTPATIFGSATGAITLSANTTPGFNGVYTYAWADDITARGPAREQLRAGTYSCTVTEQIGFLNNVPSASTTVTVVVGSDPRLDVLVQRTSNDVLLVPSGGVPPYSYSWTDGPTTAGRLALPAGAYRCTVLDSRGATRLVDVLLDTYRFYWSQNPVTTVLDAGDDYRLDPSLKPNLSFVCETWVEPVYLSEEFILINTSEQPADAQGRTTFDVQALLDAYLSEHLPELNQAYPSRADCLFRRFYLRTGQKSGLPAVVAPLTDEQQHYVVLGGLSDEEHAAGTWFAGYQAGAKPFLTWEPDRKRVLPEQPEYLYFMVDDFSLSRFLCWVRVLLADGSQQLYVSDSVEEVRRFEVYCLPAGYAQLGLAAGIFPAPVVGWEVFVTNAESVPVSEVRRYVLDADYYPKSRFFLYTNSLGGVSTLAATGAGKLSLEVKSEEAERSRFDPNLGDTLVLDRSGLPVLSVVTGPLRRAQLLTDQDALLARRVTLQSGGHYWPGRIKAATFVIGDEEGGLVRLSFDFVLPKRRRFSPRLPLVLSGQPVAPVAGGEGAAQP